MIMVKANQINFEMAVYEKRMRFDEIPGKSGVSMRTVISFRNGTPVKIHSAAAIADALGVDIEKIIDADFNRKDKGGHNDE